jgi:hypothetical protein
MLSMVAYDLDWGSIPQWLAVPGSLSVVLAFLVFRRDRENADRAQVDRVSAWATADHEGDWPNVSERRVEEGTLRCHLRNSSEVPVLIVQVAWRVDTRWMVADDAQSTPGQADVWSVEPGTESVRMFGDPQRVPPGETQEWSQPVNVAHTAPRGATALDPIRGIAVHVDWLLIVDNAGRRWEVRPETGGRAKRVGRRWRPREYMPRRWP